MVQRASTSGIGGMIVWVSSYPLFLVVGMLRTPPGTFGFALFWISFSPIVFSDISTRFTDSTLTIIAGLVAIEVGHRLELVTLPANFVNHHFRVGFSDHRRTLN